MHPPPHPVLRPIALFEALKGTIVLLTGFGLLGFLGRDNENLALEIVRVLHLNPAHRYPQIFISAMAGVSDTRLWLLAAFAGFYATVRFVEAYGLWRERRWAEWLAALSGAIYLPFELYELTRGVTWLRSGAVLVNLLIVGYMVLLLTEKRRRHAPAANAADA